MHDGNNQQHEEPYLSTFFCRALYDYQSQDASSLSFYKGDIIEVLTQLESGWWDGLLNDERGWFPSNYVQIVSEQEAESELSRSEFSAPPSDIHDSAIDVSTAMMRRQQPDQDQSWAQPDAARVNGRNGVDARASTVSTRGRSASNDFWVPKVTSDGQVSVLRRCC